LIGNDLIYLPDWPQRLGDRLERYRQKTFLAQEQIGIEKSTAPFFTEALLWSAKEAAYKIWARYNEQRRYNPKNFAINLPEEPRKFDALKYTARTLNDLEPLHFAITSHLRYNYLFTWATLAAEPLTIENFSSLTFNKKQSHLCYQDQSCPIKKTTLNAPYLLVNKQVVPVSLSHDGDVYWYLWPA
jgi:phosphopantetheinyl transferase (holo-ACP synthase)